jgi:intracellular septation protein A
MSTDTKPQGTGFDRNRLRSLAPIVVFDVGGPLALYWLLRVAGTSDVTALIISGVLPAFGVALGVFRRRHVDAIGVLVLLGIITGTVLGLCTHSARLVLMEGSVPTAIFGLTCLGTLLTSKPMLLRIAMETTAGSARGRELAARVAQPGGQQAFRTVTLVWGITFLAEAAARIGIVESVSAGNALLVVKVMPYVVMFLLIRCTGPYIRRSGLSAPASQSEGLAPAITAAADDAAADDAAADDAAADRTREPAMVG